MKQLLILGISLALLSVIPYSPDSNAHAAALVDLHAHYFMPEGSGYPFFGGFNEPLRADRWSSRLLTRVNADALEHSGVRIAVVALYSHPLFLRSLFGRQRDSIRHQISEVFNFASTHPGWMIARSPSDARKALARGKRVIILSIEGASGILENENDIHEFIDQRGIRIVTPLHFTDDEIGGAGFMPGMKIWVNPVAAIRSFFSAHRDETGVRVNPQGLTERGKQLISSLIRRGVWIDLTHASDASVRDISPLLKEAGQPALYTHAVLREAFRAERGISETALRDVASSGGIIGVLPSDDMLEGTQVRPSLCPNVCHEKCEGGRAAVASQYDVMKKTVPASRIFFGTDIDAPLTFLRPECDAVKAENPRGFWSYAQLPLLFDFLREKGVISQGLKDDSVIDEFLKAWDQATQSS